jgi:hypothetical protein
LRVIFNDPLNLPQHVRGTKKVSQSIEKWTPDQLRIVLDESGHHELIETLIFQQCRDLAIERLVSIRFWDEEVGFSLGKRCPLERLILEGWVYNKPMRGKFAF